MNPLKTVKKYLNKYSDKTSQASQKKNAKKRKQQMKDVSYKNKGMFGNAARAMRDHNARMDKLIKD